MLGLARNLYFAYGANFGSSAARAAADPGLRRAWCRASQLAASSRQWMLQPYTLPSRAPLSSRFLNPDAASAVMAPVLGLWGRIRTAIQRMPIMPALPVSLLGGCRARARAQARQAPRHLSSWWRQWIGPKRA